MPFAPDFEPDDGLSTYVYKLSTTERGIVHGLIRAFTDEEAIALFYAQYFKYRNAILFYFRDLDTGEDILDL